MSDALHAVHAALSLRESYGGPARSIPALADALAARAVRVDIVTAANAAPGDPLVLPRNAAVHLTQVPGVFDAKGLALWAPMFRRAVVERASSGGTAILHDHGMWRGMNHAMCIAARELKAPLIVSPRGMLEGAARGHRATRKRVAWGLWAKRDLAQARCLHATSTREADTLLHLGLGVPVATIPNGVIMPDAAPTADQNRTERTLLFLGRLHAVKGLMLLVEAWRRAAPAGWRLVIAGPSEDGYGRVLERAIADARVEPTVTLAGALDAAAAQRALVECDVLVLPSLTESFGGVVAEALAAARPVIATTTTPWSALTREQCGWLADPTPDALAQAITAACTHTDDATRAAMGARGRAYAQAHLSWQHVASEMIAVYAWLTGAGPQPGTVRRA